MTTPEAAAVHLSNFLRELSREGLLIEGELTISRGTRSATLHAQTDQLAVGIGKAEGE